MENAEMQPAFFLTPLVRTQEDLKKISAPYHQYIQREEGTLPKGYQRKHNFVLNSASCAGWKTKEKCILESTGTLTWSEKVNLGMHCTVWKDDE